uniref:Uncharacterized protein n=1 Tax=Rhizophora mucronata TaxID=61149 RepID=A0A2P2JJG2_RHIMU
MCMESVVTLIMQLECLSQLNVKMLSLGQACYHLMPIMVCQMKLLKFSAQ